MKRTSLLWLVGGIALLLLAACGGGVPAEVATVQPASTAEVAPTEAEIAPTDPPATTPPDTVTPLPPTATLTPEPTEPPTAEPTANNDPYATDEPTAEPPATDKPTAEPTATSAPTAAATETAPAAPASASVSIEDFQFSPATITVAAGTTVTWTHLGEIRHTVTADDGSFDSPTMAGGDTFAFTFDTPGTYAYYCRFHGGAGQSGMSGVVIVTP